MLLAMSQATTAIPTETRPVPISRVEKRARAQADGRPRVTLSFYRYVRISDPVAFQARLRDAWGDFDCMGRIYVASEGINAQMNVPKQYFDAFDAWTQSQPELAGVPYKIAVDEGEELSFYKLAIKVKDKIVADGLDDDSFNVIDTGEYLTAAEMNEYVDDPDAVIVDMRNSYESEVGHFEGAITPNVETFRDELKLTPQTLKIHKNKKIALYCTGGIRCEKASAWLKHNGYAHVKHLKGGIIDYAHQVKAQGLENKFRGKNFVFDARLGERVGTDVISTCHLCHMNKSDSHYHCHNQICATFFIGCDNCIKNRAGYCSRRCQLVDKLPAKQKKSIARFYNLRIRPLRKFKKMRLG